MVYLRVEELKLVQAEAARCEESVPVCLARLVRLALGGVVLEPAFEVGEEWVVGIEKRLDKLEQLRDTGIIDTQGNGRSIIRPLAEPHPSKLEAGPDEEDPGFDVQTW